MTEQASHGGAGPGSYLAGAGLALALTLIPFAAVGFMELATPVTLSVIAVCAVAQILVHLVFFLHLDLRLHRWNTISAAFSAVILFILVGGTIWLFYSLHLRTMTSPPRTDDPQESALHGAPAPGTDAFTVAGAGRHRLRLFDTDDGSDHGER